MARHSDPRGRFDIAYERASIYDGISTELQHTVGQVVKWLIFDPAQSEKDSIYAVASQTGGRKWKRAVSIPAFGAFVYQGASEHNVRGFYNTDLLRASFAADEIIRAIPDIVTDPDQHILDRIAYRGRLFVPRILNLRGLIQDQYTVITVEGNQVNPEESVNDHIFTENQEPYSIIRSQDDEYVSDFTYLPPEHDQRLVTET
jgi:hypothetical protein